MEVCVLASGSKGNAIFVASGTTRVLIDAGLSAKSLGALLKEVGIAPETLDAILITHDHDDHCRGVEVFSRKYGLKLFANEGTARGVDLRFPGKTLTWDIFDTTTTFRLGELDVEPFTVSHDASDPVGFVLDDGQTRLCVVTDLGQGTALVRHKLAQCDVVILESNHDYEMLMQSQRSWMLKSRVAGRSGHLSNEEAAELLCESASARLHTLFLAHLSEECNTPTLARRVMQSALERVGRGDVRIEVLAQERPSAYYRFEGRS